MGKITIIDALLFFTVFVCFLRLFYYQAKVIFTVLKPFEKGDDDRRFGPFRVMGPAKGKRLYALLNNPNYAELRNKWALSWFMGICSFAALFLWMGIFRKLVFGISES